MKTPDFSHFRKEPPPEFTDALYQKITTRRSFFFGAHTMFEKPFSTVRVSFILIVSLLIVGTCVQQVFTPRQVQVGDFWVYEMSKKFICAGDTVYPSYTPSSPLPTPQPAPINIPTADLEEFRQELGINLSIPTWAPEGFTLQGTMS